MSAFSLHTFFVLLYQFLINETETMLTLSYLYPYAKVQQQNEWKKKPGVSEYGP